MQIYSFFPVLINIQKNNCFLGKFVGFIFPKCNKEDYAPEGEPLHAIVDDFADNQSVWFEEFIPALEKMVENGYDDLLGSPMPVGSYQFT